MGVCPLVAPVDHPSFHGFQLLDDTIGYMNHLGCLASHAVEDRVGPMRRDEWPPFFVNVVECAPPGGLVHPPNGVRVRPTGGAPVFRCSVCDKLVGVVAAEFASHSRKGADDASAVLPSIGLKGLEI